MDQTENIVGRIAASLTILVTSGVTLYGACLRSSTIYFYELDSTTVIFMAMPLAVVFPLLLSLALFISYLSNKPKETGVQTCDSSPQLARRGTRRISQVPSDLRRITEERDDYSPTRMHSEVIKNLETEKLVEKLEKEIGPLETGAAQPAGVKTRKDSTTMTSENSGDFEGESTPPSFHLDSGIPGTEIDDLKPQIDFNESESTDLYAEPPSTVMSSRRSSSTGRVQKELNRTRKLGLLQKESPVVETKKDFCELLKEIEQTSLLTYALGGFDLKIMPRRKTQFKPKHSILSLIIEIIATHVPVWLCVGAFYVFTLEFLRLNFAYYFYFHEDVMEFSALFLALGLGAIHEFKGHWITNDILALCSIYVVVSRLQPISFHSATALLVGFLIFDLFWLYIIDLLSTVIKESKAPVMIIVPRDNLGNKQSLATLDIMVPGVFLNLILKYSSMLDKKLFNFDFCALYCGLLITTLLAIWRRKVTPAMVLPAIFLIATSMLLTSSPRKLWKFMIKH